MSRDIAKIFANIHAFDPARFVAHLTPDARFRFANADPAIGREAVKEAVGGAVTSRNIVPLRPPTFRPRTYTRHTWR